MKINCHFKTLHENEVGTIRVCKSCGNLSVEIGHLMTLISPEPFRLILADFKERHAFYEKNKETGNASEPVLICLNSKNLFLKLSNAEMEQVMELFEIAHHMLMINQLITSN